MSLHRSLEAAQFTLAPIDPALVPENIADHLGVRSSMYVDSPPLQTADFDLLQVANFPATGAKTYVSSQNKTYSTNGQTEKSFQFVDTQSDDSIVGYGEVRFALTDEHPYFKDKPFIGWIFTKPEHRGRRSGNLLGRLLVMREVTETQLGLPLYGDSLIATEAVKFAERLVEAGLAEVVPDCEQPRFRSVQSQA